MTLLMPCIACFGRRLMAVAGPRILGPAACHDAQRREQRGSAVIRAGGIPAEAADGDERTGGTPGGQHAEALPSTPAC